MDTPEPEEEVVPMSPAEFEGIDGRWSSEAPDTFLFRVTRESLAGRIPSGMLRRRRAVLLAGLDAAGKTRLASALAQPDDPSTASEVPPPTDIDVEERLHLASSEPDPDRSAALLRPFVVRTLDDRLLKGKATDSAPLQPSKAPAAPAVPRIDLLDFPGARPYRELWHQVAEAALPIGVATQPTTEPTDASRAPDTFPRVSAILFVVGAHDVTRASLAWSEFADLVARAPNTPTAVVLARTDSSPSTPAMSVADWLKANENMAPLQNGAAGWTAFDVDLRPPPRDGGDANPFALAGGLRRVAQWLGQSAGESRV